MCLADPKMTATFPVRSLFIASGHEAVTPAWVSLQLHDQRRTRQPADT